MKNNSAGKNPALPERCPEAPLLFSPVYKTVLWGGSRMASKFGRTAAPEKCGESWELSAVPGSVTRVACGPLEGAGLDELAAAYGAAFTGAAAPDPREFPLLFKIIDANLDLSVQVHPGDDAPPSAGKPKSECWTVLDAAPGAALYAGTDPRVTREDFAAALAAGGMEAAKLLDRIPAKAGEIVDIPGGTVHALGAGCLVYEVQQASDVTFRLYDWGRVDADGRPRKLHLEEGLAVARFGTVAPRHLAASDGLDTPHFSVKMHEIAAPAEFRGGDGFQAFFTVSGEVEISAGGTSVRAPAGRTVLVPACAREAALSPLAAESCVLRTAISPLRGR